MVEKLSVMSGERVMVAGLAIGTVREGDVTRLLLSDGSEIFCPDKPVFLEVSASTAVAVSSHISGAPKVDEILTIVSPLKSPDH